MKALIVMLVLVTSCFGESVTSLNTSPGTKTEDRSPMVGTFSGCSTEPIYVEGVLITQIQQFFNGNIGFVQFKTSESAETWAVGVNSGLSYKVKIDESSKFWFDANTLSSISIKQKFVLKGAGPDNNLSIAYKVRFVWDESAFQTVFEHLNAVCK